MEEIVSKQTQFMVGYEQEEEEWEHEGSSVSTSNSEEPSPLGLTLKKTPSLVELIQWSLCQRSCPDGSEEEAMDEPSEDARRTRDANTQATMNQDKDKKKATNFSALSLQIGEWERVSRYEGDLVVKCYFAKRKLVWEVLEGGLKSKIEIQWSDVTGISASCPENGPGILEIQISRPPMFSKESNPQPRKHTQWQPTSDFTGGQATLYRIHVLQFSPGVLDRHYAKLIEADPQLNMLSKRGFNARVESPYFHDTRFGPYRDQAGQYYRWSSQLADNIYNNFNPPLQLQPSVYISDHGKYDPPHLSRRFFNAEQNFLSLVPEFEHFDPEEVLHNSRHSVSTSEDSYSMSSNRNRLEEIAEYLLDDSFMSDEHSGIATEDSMMFLHQDVNANRPLLQENWWLA
ncbi:hypothetical protein SUGI_1143100 [Cryptomeria japonica]|uniref:uncharacterized protein LOC131063935 n=1 Tax=Cryptomeria japonica TaxID=3369 RepID=UPI002414A9EC|nr:uncharacterized protein LOC131063935 [Cryptomeria japonica]GLJ53582.1 hypothetical protein SUGI_1143100 [Cryptomeria japonica]